MKIVYNIKHSKKEEKGKSDMKILKKILYNIIRPFAKKDLKHNLGKVVEEDEKIIE